MSCQLFFPKYRYSKTQKKHFFILLIDADGLFPRLIRGHDKAIAIKVSYVQKYNHKQKKIPKSRITFLSFWSSSVLLVLANMYRPCSSVINSEMRCFFFSNRGFLASLFGG